MSIDDILEDILEHLRVHFKFFCGLWSYGKLTFKSNSALWSSFQVKFEDCGREKWINCLRRHPKLRTQVIVHLPLETVKLTSYFCHCLSMNEVPVPLFLLLFLLCFRIIKFNCSLCQLISYKSRKINFFQIRAGIAQSVKRLP